MVRIWSNTLTIVFDFSSLIQIDKCLVEEFRSANTKGNSLKHCGVLPSLTTMCQWRDASSLQLCSSSVELFPSGWHCNAILGKHSGVCPDPVNAVNVDGGCTPCAFTLHVTGN